MAKERKKTVVIGKIGEELAVDFLIQKGYVVLKKNYRYRRGEIDIIVSQFDILVFVEVKARKNSYYGYPEESAIQERKKEKIIETAEGYIMETNWEGKIQFDIISIILKKVPEIKHFRDVF